MKISKQATPDLVWPACFWLNSKQSFNAVLQAQLTH